MGIIAKMFGNSESQSKTEFRCNLLIMGKTGTGKSSLLNYLCDKKFAQTGAGKPVTGEGIYEYDVRINNQEVKIFDSWGIEAGKVDRWQHLITESLKQHGVQKSMEDWFHSVIYCIQAGGGRVEDVDAAIINKFLGEGYHLTVVLTKADQVSEDEEKLMKKVIYQSVVGTPEYKCELNIISTCAEKKTLRNGTTTKPFGKEDVQKAILEGWRDTIIDRMPKHVIARLSEMIDFWCKDTIDNHLLMGDWKITGNSKDNKKIYSDLAEKAKEALQEIENESLPKFLKDAIESCRKANAALKSVFDIELDYSSIESKLSEAVTAESKAKFQQIWDRILLVPAIVDLIKSFNKASIDNEKDKLAHYIKDLGELMKSEIAKAEPDVKQSIANALK